MNVLLTKARQGGLSSGGLGMENSMWPLYERIIRLHSLQVDFFAAAVYDIQLVIPLTQSTPFTKEISSIITNISRPEDILRFADDPDDYSIIESLDNALSISESFRSPLVEEIRKNIQTIRKCLLCFLRHLQELQYMKGNILQGKPRRPRIHQYRSRVCCLFCLSNAGYSEGIAPCTLVKVNNVKFEGQQKIYGRVLQGKR